MKIGKIGYITSGVIHIINSVISIVFNLRAENTWWAFIGVVAVIIPSLIQTIINIKRNKNKNGLTGLYIILGILLLMCFTGFIILIVMLTGIEKIPLY